MLHSIELELEIPFHDVDSMQIAWHGHYVKYFELARCELLNSINYGYRDMYESGYGWPIVDMKLRYPRPARFEQKIIVQATVKEWEHRLKITYKIMCKETHEILTKGETTQVAINLETEDTCLRSPAILFEKLGLEA